jgi:hypothetical protein
MPKESILLLNLATTLKQTGEYLHSIAKFHKQMQPFISWAVKLLEFTDSLVDQLGLAETIVQWEGKWDCKCDLIEL